MVRDAPAHRAQAQRQQSVLSQASDRKVSDILQSIRTDHEVGSAAIDSAPAIETGFDTMEEGDIQVIPHILIWIHVVEKLRGLNQSDWSSSLLGEDRKYAQQVVPPSEKKLMSFVYFFSFVALCCCCRNQF